MAVLAGVLPATAGLASAIPLEGAPASDMALLASGLPPPRGKTELVSQNVDLDFPSGPSVEASISENGRYVAYSSIAADLVPNDTNQAQDVFVTDRRTGRAKRLPLPDILPKGGRSYEPSMAADGSAVAFTYIPPATTSAAIPSMVIVWDRDTNSSEIVSKRRDGTPARNSREPSISGNGRYVAYTTDDGRIAPGDGNETSDVYVYDRNTEEAELASANPDGRAANGGGTRPAISANGRFVAFDSQATDVIALPGSTEAPEVYLRDLDDDSTELISVNTSGGYGNGQSIAASISANGNVVAFESTATDLVDGDTQVQDVFVRDRQAGTTVIASVGASGGAADGPSGQAALASDGQIVAFISLAEDLVASAGPRIELAAQAQGRSEVYARELTVGDTIRISEAIDGGPGGGASVGPSVGGNGRYVAFASTSPKLVNGDDNELADIFVRDLPGDPRINPAVLDFGASAVGQPAIPLGAIVSNAGWAPVALGEAKRTGAQAGDFSILADGCNDRRLRRGQPCTVSVGFTAGGPGNRRATLEVPGAFPGEPLTARLRGGGSQASLELDPPIGSPGIVTIVSGRGFPDGATIQLEWSDGITPDVPPVVADDDGRFRVPVLVFHNDLIGERELIATRAAGPSFPEVREPMLVVASPSKPSTWDWANQPPFTPPLIVRR